MGRDEILGSDDQLGSVASSALRTTSKVAKKLVTLPIDLTERVFSATTRPLAHAFIGREEILGTFVGDDEVCAAREGSRSDRQALRRRLPASTSGYNSHWTHVRGDDPGLIGRLRQKWIDYWKREDVEARNRQGKEQQINNLSKKFFDAANQATLYDKPFKNPLTNADMAYLYRATDGEGKWVFEWDRFYTGESATRLLKDIDTVLAQLRQQGIKVSGDAPTGEALEELKERAKAGDARAAAALAKLRRSTSSGDGPTCTPAEKDMAKKILTVKRAADAGDVPAQRKIAELEKEIPTLISQARGGNERARRNLQILRALGFGQARGA